MRNQDVTLIDETYLLRQYYMEYCKQVTYLWAYLGAWRAGDHNNVVSKLNADLAGEVWLNDERDAKRRNSVMLHGFRYNQAAGGKTFGQTRTVRNEEVDAGKSRIYDHSEFVEDTIVTDTIKYELSERVTAALRQEYRASVVTRASAKASGSFGPAEAEVSTETEVSFESAVGVDKESSYSKAETHEMVRPIPIKAGAKVQAIIQATVLETETPYTVSGQVDHDLTVDIENWAGKGVNGDLWTSSKARNRVTFIGGTDGFLRFLNGYDTRFPRMALFVGRLNAAVARGDTLAKKAEAAWGWLEDKSQRTIEAQGVKRRVYQDNATLALRSVV